MQQLLQEIKQCKLCSKYLEPNPVLSVAVNSKIIVIGHAPGRIVHNTNIPWNDKSGDNLRTWLGVDKNTFYNNEIFGIMAMGFCYPGTGKTGDNPPRPECAPTWHSKIFAHLKNVKLVLLIGKHAQDYYLKDKAKENLTNTVKAFNDYAPAYFPLPHPSPRNNIWMKKNEWFASEVLPSLQMSIKSLI